MFCRFGVLLRRERVSCSCLESTLLYEVYVLCCAAVANDATLTYKLPCLKVVVSNETMAQSSHDLLWRLEDAFNEFPKTMQWFKKVDLNAPTNAAVKPRKRACDESGTARSGIGGICGGAGEADDPQPDLSDRDVRLCVPAYSSMGNILEVSFVYLSASASRHPYLCDVCHRQSLVNVLGLWGDP